MSVTRLHANAASSSPCSHHEETHSNSPTGSTRCVGIYDHIRHLHSKNKPKCLEMLRNAMAPRHAHQDLRTGALDLNRYKGAPPRSRSCMRLKLMKLMKLAVSHPRLIRLAGPCPGTAGIATLPADQHCANQRCFSFSRSSSDIPVLHLLHCSLHARPSTFSMSSDFIEDCWRRS